MNGSGATWGPRWAAAKAAGGEQLESMRAELELAKAAKALRTIEADRAHARALPRCGYCGRGLFSSRRRWCPGACTVLGQIKMPPLAGES